MKKIEKKIEHFKLMNRLNGPWNFWMSSDGMDGFLVGFGALLGLNIINAIIWLGSSFLPGESIDIGVFVLCELPFLILVFCFAVHQRKDHSIDEI